MLVHTVEVVLPVAQAISLAHHTTARIRGPTDRVLSPVESGLSSMTITARAGNCALAGGGTGLLIG